MKHSFLVGALFGLFSLVSCSTVKVTPTKPDIHMSPYSDQTVQSCLEPGRCYLINKEELGVLLLRAYNSGVKAAQESYPEEGLHSAPSGVSYVHL